MSDGVALHDNLNAVEELMKVNSGEKAKGEVFESFKAQYAQHFAHNEELEGQKQQIAGVISQLGPQLNQLVNTVGSDP